MAMTLNPEHPRWGEFMERLYLAFNVNVHCDMGLNWRRCENDQIFTRSILAEMGMDVEATCHFFESVGYRCDCAVLFGRSPGWRNLPPIERRHVMAMEHSPMHAERTRTGVITRDT